MASPFDIAWTLLKGNPFMSTYQGEESIHPAAMNYARLPINEAKYDDRWTGRETPSEIVSAIDSNEEGTEFVDAMDKLTPEDKKQMMDRYRQAAKKETHDAMRRIMPPDNFEHRKGAFPQHVQRMPR